MKRIIRGVVFIPFLLAGIFAIVFAFRDKEDNEKFFKTAKPVDAVIDDIVTTTRKTGTGRKKKTRTDHDVFVTYEVDGVKYEHILRLCQKEIQLNFIMTH